MLGATSRASAIMWANRTSDAPCTTAVRAHMQPSVHDVEEHDRRKEDAVQALILRAESQAELVQVGQPVRFSDEHCAESTVVL